MATGVGLPPRPRTPTRLPRGPKAYHVPTTRVVGPGTPPPGFLRPTTSATEWMVYWALAKIYGLPQDPRQPPFIGGPPHWAYQEGQGSDGTRSKPDFVIYRKRRTVLRVQTEYRHLFTDIEKQTYDRIQKIFLSTYNDVIDIYDSDFVNDKTGRAVILVVKQALGLIQKPDPIVAGTALRGSRMDNGQR